ncbi:MAG: GGDEF domain-containing protein [Lachnospiraceae bacterium]|nr:GGDEF domain-containing protein [Lachnospiraceae bacterium]
MTGKKENLTIGILVSGILDDFTIHICNGIMAEARVQGVNTLIFPGKYIDRDLTDNHELMYEYQYGTVFSYVKKGCLDALIIAADCIGCFTTPERIRQLLQQFDGIPSVLIASRLDGYINVTYDNETGIREGLEYLIRVCKCTRIGMVGGHSNNTDAMERLAIFRKVLAENQIDFPDCRYTEGDLSQNSHEVYRTFLDANPDLDAIFCVNDDTALGLYEELYACGKIPGKDISVLGFDDCAAAAKATPALSSVRADPNQLGEAALRSVLELYYAGAAEGGTYFEDIHEDPVPMKNVCEDSALADGFHENSAAEGSCSDEILKSSALMENVCEGSVVPENSLKDSALRDNVCDGSLLTEGSRADQASSRSLQPLKAAADIVIPTHFVLRDSFVRTDRGGKSLGQIMDALPVSFHDIFYRNYHAEEQVRRAEIKESYMRLFNTITEHFTPADAPAGRFFSAETETASRGKTSQIVFCLDSGTETGQYSPESHEASDCYGAFDTHEVSECHGVFASHKISGRCEASDRHDTDEIASILDKFFDGDVVNIIDIDGLMTVFDEFYHALYDLQTDAESRLQLQDVFSMIYQRIITAMNRHSAAVMKQEQQANYDMKLFVQNILQFEQGTDESYCSVLSNLDWLQIENAWLYLLPAPAEHSFREPFETPGELILKTERTNGITRSIPLLRQPQSLDEMYEYTKPDAQERRAQLLLPLFSGKMVYGVLICDMTQALFVNGEFLVNQLSSAIKMILLLQANEKNQAQLERNLETLKDHNIELDVISKSDPLTGLLNVRGFYAQAEEQIAALQKAGRHQVLLYIDMDDLKLINDRFGHREGDISLHQIGKILQELVRGRGIAGRIGGDEFTCLMEVDAGDALEADDSESSTEAGGTEPELNADNAGDTAATQRIVSTLYRQFDQYNQTSGKPYFLTVSAGVCLVRPGDIITLKEALMLADQKLYKEKKQRKKTTC